MGIDTANRGASDPIIAINVTPLVDVCLVLVIIFMVTAPLISQTGIQVNSVKKEVGGKSAEAQTEPPVETIYVKALPEEAVELNGERVELARFPERLQGYLERSPDRQVYINAQPGVNYGRVVTILDICRQRGAQKLAMLNDREGLLERTLIFQKP